MFTALRVPRKVAAAALISACLFGVVACGDGERSDLLIDFTQPTAVEAEAASQVNQSEGSDSLAGDPTPTPVMAGFVATVIPPTPEPIPTLVPRGQPTPLPTPTPAPQDGFTTSEILDAELSDFTRDPSCSALDELDEAYNLWTQLRTNTISDIRITVEGATNENLEIRLTEARAAASALAPHVGPMLASFDAALGATSGEANQRISAVRSAEEAAWTRIPGQIEASFNSQNSVNDVVFDLLSALGSSDIDDAKTALAEFEVGACTAAGRASGADAGASGPTAQEQAEIDALCAEVASDPDAAEAAAVLSGICNPTG